MQRAEPLAWRPRGLSDSIDGTTAFNGAMSALQNLIPDPSTSQIWECRPAAQQLFTVAAPATVISVFKIVGNILYGMVGQGSGGFAGFDIPFALNLATNLAVTVTGIAVGTVPQSQPATGTWTPPIMDLVGNKLVVTHAGFGATANFIGWFDVSTPTTPVWHAGNITGPAGIPFTVPPISVAQFNGRAYYITNVPVPGGVSPGVVFSDINNATVATNATQILTFGDNTPLTALGQLRLYNQLGGIVQALIVFKDSINLYQITGDATNTPSALAVNAMNFATGTKAPNSVCSTPRGLAFIAPDGLRIIDFSANISDPIGYDGQGVVVPFIFSNVPSRMCAACNGNIIRITTQNQLALNNPFQEYWYDIVRKIWSGPHTSAMGFIQPFGGTFIASLISPATGVPVNAILFQSDPTITANSAFVENGTQLTWAFNTVQLPDTDKMGNIHVSQALLDCALSNNLPIQVNCTDQNSTLIDNVSLMATGSAMTWGTSTWGSPTTWGVAGTALAPRKLPWHFPLVFSRGRFNITGQSAKEVRLGALHLRYKQLRYLTDLTAAA
jgi:hypothetical protein